jgi:uncharacterized membrane protein
MSQNQRLSARQEETAKIPSFKITGDFKSAFLIVKKKKISYIFVGVHKENTWSS